jgi:hypothetical protein
MNLDELVLLFDEDEMSIDVPSKDQLYQMYGIFLSDFHKTTLIHKGKNVTFNTNLSKHYLFKGKYEGFVHIVTRKNNYTGKRQYDRERANRLHWIKPILENWQNPLVSYFEDFDKNGDLQYFYWVQLLNFIVILREVTPNLLLVTSYCVDSYQVTQFRKQLNEYRNKK